jgi:hypothetical protein
MARRGQSKAFLKALRKKHKLGEFAPKRAAAKKRSTRAKKRTVVKKSEFKGYGMGL